MLAVAAALGASVARADAPEDGLYGRFDGDLILSAGAGAGALLTAGDEPLVFVADLRARFLDTAGLLVAPELDGSSLRVVTAVEVRPLFPARFLLNTWSGSAWLDLLVDSIGFELGVAVDRLTEQGRGVALAVGLGLDVPLVLPGTLADGLFLRLGARHVRASEPDLRGPDGGGASWTFYAALTLRAVTDIGLAAREMPRFRPGS